MTLVSHNQLLHNQLLADRDSMLFRIYSNQEVTPYTACGSTKNCGESGERLNYHDMQLIYTSPRPTADITNIAADFHLSYPLYVVW